MAVINVRAIPDFQPIYDMVSTFSGGIRNANLFAARQISQDLRFDVLPKIVESLAAKAGGGFPAAYTDHLVAVIRTTFPIQVVVTGDEISLGWGFESLGDYGDLNRGYHHQALAAFTMGTTKSGKSKGTRNMPKMSLPSPPDNAGLYERTGVRYQGLDKERRQAFWEEAVIGRQLPWETAFPQGKSFFMVEDAPTFNEVALARIAVWIASGKAPQWLLLEDGMRGVSPTIEPYHISNVFDIVGSCVAEKIYVAAITALVKLAERAAIGSTGIPHLPAGSSAGGQFAPFKLELDESLSGDFSSCFGRL